MNSRCAFLVILLLLRAPTIDAAPVNLNVKSGLLSRLLGNNTPPPTRNREQDSTTASTERPNSSKGKVSLDLSGTYHCLVAGPSSPPQPNTVDGGRAPVPLIETGTFTKGWSPPSLTCSVGYNFSQAWYGACRLLTNLSWSYRRNDDDESSNTPLTINLQAEKGLLDENEEYAAEVGISLKTSSAHGMNNSPSIKLRWQQDDCKQVTVAAPLLNRVGIVWKSVFPSQESHFTTHQQSIPPNNVPDWWIPNLKITTTGRLTADNQVGFALPDKRRMGFRLMLSRQVGWSAFGGTNTVMDDHLGTLMKLQLTTSDNQKTSFSSMTMTSVLERPIDSTQFTLSHEQVHRIK